MEPKPTPVKVMSEFERAKQGRDGKWLTIKILVTPGVSWTTWSPVDLKGLTEKEMAIGLQTMASYYLK